ncbi:D-isomer specific 2-hydroxyacid dehydrogenase [Pseudoneurospora amorphoporcata]|uniref:D-isomer specific 2-hydroxyacid dehydrogenase n=1 Tax=Pseudoneurospora amorphoporcata TaxID=241081 RepID=A0AAN6SK58_9PEZI|nr:D-isomer specific 2-hydroxyacid dehydrogenase [Pseudoneurospora amorphoporcata]
MSSEERQRPKILLLGTIEHAHDAWKQVTEIADIIQPTSSSRSDFIAECASGAFDSCLLAYRTFDSTLLTGLLNQELISALPPSIKYIIHVGAGYDVISIPACTARGIRVSNTPSAVDEATADCALFLLLGAMRNFNAGMTALRLGQWRGGDEEQVRNGEKGIKMPALGRDPRGKTLGILGMGGIGKTLASKVAGAFGMKVTYLNRRRDEEGERELRDQGVEIEWVGGDGEGGFEEGLKRLLGESDVLSLNLPLNAETRHIISTKEFALMKRGIVIINTARGAVMDEAALVEALESGQVHSVGLDVYENEPEIHRGLLANPNVMLVPHMGTWTVETETKMEEWAISNVRMAIEEGKLRSIVPEQRDMQ